MAGFTAAWAAPETLSNIGNPYWRYRPPQDMYVIGVQGHMDCHVVALSGELVLPQFLPAYRPPPALLLPCLRIACAAVGFAIAGRLHTQ